MAERNHGLVNTVVKIQPDRAEGLYMFFCVLSYIIFIVKVYNMIISYL